MLRHMDSTLVHLDYARMYANGDQYAKAREQLAIIPTLPKKDEDDDQFRKDAAALMEEIKNK